MLSIPRWSTYGLTFLGGIALGVAGCLLVVRKRTKKEIEDRVEHEVSAMKEYYETPKEPVPEILPSEERVVEPDGDVASEDSVDPGRESIFVRPDTSHVLYNRVYVIPDIEKKPDLLETGPDEWPEETEEEFNQRDMDYNDDPIVREARDTEKHHEPYLVDGNSYLNEYPQYDKIGMVYWAGDDTLLHENEDLVDDERSWIGDVIDKFRNGELQETAYVRNHAISTDIEIEYKPGMYSLSTFGIDDDVLDDLEEIAEDKARGKPKSREESDGK